MRCCRQSAQNYAYFDGATSAIHKVCILWYVHVVQTGHVCLCRFLETFICLQNMLQLGAPSGQVYLEIALKTSAAVMMRHSTDHLC